MGSGSAWCARWRDGMAAPSRWPTIIPVPDLPGSWCRSISRYACRCSRPLCGGRAAGSGHWSAAAVGSACVESACGFDDQVAKALRVEPGAAQHRRHHLVVDQLVEGGLIAAAIGASGHVPLLTSVRRSTIIPKDVVIVTRVRKLSGKVCGGVIGIVFMVEPLGTGPSTQLHALPRSARARRAANLGPCRGGPW